MIKNTKIMVYSIITKTEKEQYKLVKKEKKKAILKN